MTKRIEFTGPKCPGCGRPRKVTIYARRRKTRSLGHAPGGTRIDRDVAKTCGRGHCQAVARSLTIIKRHEEDT